MIAFSIYLTIFLSATRALSPLIAINRTNSTNSSSSSGGGFGDSNSNTTGTGTGGAGAGVAGGGGVGTDKMILHVNPLYHKQATSPAASGSGLGLVPAQGPGLGIESNDVSSRPRGRQI